MLEQSQTVTKRLLRLFTPDVFIAGGQIRMANYPEAVSLLMKFAVACDTIGVRPCKAYLGAVVVWLYAEDAAQAWAVYQVASGISVCTKGQTAVTILLLSSPWKCSPSGRPLHSWVSSSVISRII